MTNPEEAKKEFYSDLRRPLTKILKDDRLIIAGDINARGGGEVDKWPGIFGPHETGKCNSNRELLSLCSEFNTVRIHDDKVHKRLVKEIETALEKYTIEESDLEGSWNAHSKPDST